eukprot:NODE_11710_length_298_cov_14.775100_g10797_i0.p3 GENE.NODE_11710_length_298_cov_14.775100_g10797_i0~~NODE_11710_length_298_cov_14.775100_g10797_i0.p3  ORF type:complete len:60 (-),score=18.88 NODE_11710_length_298_cov_14.775100_g10797_i0:117-269(-)
MGDSMRRHPGLTLLSVCSNDFYEAAGQRSGHSHTSSAVCACVFDDGLCYR